MIAELCNCESALIQEIGDHTMHRKDVALTYAMSMLSSECDSINWGKVNRAIIDRWSRYALVWIKTRAWELFDKKRKAYRESQKSDAG